MAKVLIFHCRGCIFCLWSGNQGPACCRYDQKKKKRIIVKFLWGKVIDWEILKLHAFNYIPASYGDIWNSLLADMGYRLDMCSLVSFSHGSDSKESACNWETWVWFLHWEDPLEEDMATHSSILTWRISMDRGDWKAIVHGATKSWTWLRDFQSYRL